MPAGVGSMAAAPGVQSRRMQCEKCAGWMDPVKSFRLSGCLVAAGFALVVSSLLAVALGVLTAIGSTRGTATATAKAADEAKAGAVAKLGRVSGLPPAVINEFRQTATVSEPTITRLPFDQQSEVRRVLVDYGLAMASSGGASLFVAGLGGFVVLVLFAFGVPGVIVGLLLVRRRKLWRCAACGYGFERV